MVSIILLLTIDAKLMQETGSIPLLAGLLEHLDRYNHLAPGHERDDNEDLAWPGIMGTPSVTQEPIQILSSTMNNLFFFWTVF